MCEAQTTATHDNPHSLTSQLSRALGARESWLVPLSRDELLALVAAYGGQTLITPLAGTPLKCVDLRDLGQRVRSAQTCLVVDVTEQGMCGCAAVRLGAHVAVLSCDEKLCAVSVSRDVEQALPGLTSALYATATTDQELLETAERAIAAKGELWCITSDAAQVVAAYLRCHPHIEEVRYPGLRDDPSYEVAARTLMRGFGPRVDYRTCEAAVWRQVVCDSRDARVQVLELESMLG